MNSDEWDTVENNGIEWILKVITIRHSLNKEGGFVGKEGVYKTITNEINS